MSAEHYTYEATEFGDFAVYAWGTYERTSVLAGQPKKSFVGAFDTLEQVLENCPKAVARGTIIKPRVSLAHLPDESTPVAGGLYPDDWAD